MPQISRLADEQRLLSACLFSSVFIVAGVCWAYLAVARTERNRSQESKNNYKTNFFHGICL
jgi:hypothetical protein